MYEQTAHKEVEEAGLEPTSVAIWLQIENAEYECRRALAEITRRVEALNKDVNTHGILVAAQLMANSAGASGPIGSQWEKLIAAASRPVLARVGLVKTEATK